MAPTRSPADHITDSQERKPLGFFDLPREIRDVIYEYSITSMRDDRWRGHSKSGTDWTAHCHCQQGTLAIIRPRPPYFAHHPESCLVPDLFLLSTTLVSRQFAAEIRPVFFRNTAFHLETSENNERYVRGGFGGPLLKDYHEFISALGLKAKELRRLMIVVTKGQPRADDVHGPHSEDPEDHPDFKVADAEHELKGLESVLHRSISILMVARIWQDETLVIRFFHCRASVSANKPFVAEEIDGPEQWEGFE